jgi:hypothetical protein
LEARELPAKLLEGHHYEPRDESLAKLEERGSIEMNAEGWQVTPAGRSVYVIRDQRRPGRPERR